MVGGLEQAVTALQRQPVRRPEVAAAALDRARKADAAGKAKECANALVEARQVYGLQ